MQKEQPQTHHGGTGEQETELGSTAPVEGEEKQPEDPNTLDTGGIEDKPVESDNAPIRNPAGDDISGAVEGDEGSGRNI